MVSLRWGQTGIQRGAYSTKQSGLVWFGLMTFYALATSNWHKRTNDDAHLGWCAQMAVHTYTSVDTYGGAHLWRCALVAVCTYGSVHLWQCVLMAVCTYGSVYLWQCTPMAVCTYGSVYLWQCALMAV